MQWKAGAMSLMKPLTLTNQSLSLVLNLTAALHPGWMPHFSHPVWPQLLTNTKKVENLNENATDSGIGTSGLLDTSAHLGTSEGELLKIFSSLSNLYGETSIQEPEKQNDTEDKTDEWHLPSDQEIWPPSITLETLAPSSWLSRVLVKALWNRKKEPLHSFLIRASPRMWRGQTDHSHLYGGSFSSKCRSQPSTVYQRTPYQTLPTPQHAGPLCLLWVGSDDHLLLLHCVTSIILSTIRYVTQMNKCEQMLYSIKVAKTPIDPLCRNYFFGGI